MLGYFALHSGSKPWSNPIKKEPAKTKSSSVMWSPTKNRCLGKWSSYTSTTTSNLFLFSGQVIGSYG